VGFSPLDRRPDLPALEVRVLERWRQRDVFRRSLQAREGAEPFVFYEGPPTANGRPGVHHVEARVFKDIFPRYRTMKGYRAPRKAGWDCHGIPVEVEVEKELGFHRKQDIEDFGVAEFNARCRASVQRYVGEWERLTERIGFWVDTDDAYWTMDPTYIDSVWWSLTQLWDRGLIYQGDRVVPYCPRCGTTLSDHEVAQGYARTEDPSLFVRFPMLEGPLAEVGAALLVWTTTPWTLVSNTAVAIGPDIDYVLVRAAPDGPPVVLAGALVDEVLGAGAERIRAVAHDELLGAHYRPPFNFVGPGSADGTPPADWHYVVSADYVTTREGTGVVHIAPAFGADDMATARAHGLPVVNPVDAEGRFVDAVTGFAGQFVKDADQGIIALLRERGLLHAVGTYTHDYPFCWRCGTPLLYYARPSWYIATAKHRDELLARNAEVDWHPEHVRDGRYGDWLANNVDWNISRERYWGTPLPLWRCDTCDHITAVGSRAQLTELAGRDLTDLDPHRPYVDEITFACPACRRGSKRRVPEVIDAWHDSGAMPFAQFGHPWVPGSAELFAQRFPADFICEALDQTRGWFYSLMAESTLLFGENSYRSVLCLGLIVDDDGRKMSKSQGNIIDPWSLIDTYGADALRWQMLTDGSPWVNRRVGDESVGMVVRRLLLTLWNTAVFFTTYAALDGWSPVTSSAAAVADRDVMDRWVLAELADVVGVVDQALWRYDTTTAGARLSQFIDDLSNWYVRRTRRRFWSPDGAGSPDKDAAFATLHECLTTLVVLLAPFTPFIADELHEHLVGAVDADAPDSVHLCDFPQAQSSHRDDGLRAAMQGARQVVTLGLAARNDAGIGVRQPLARALATMPDSGGWAQVAGVVADELNVKALDVPESSADTVSVHLRPNFRALGPGFGRDTSSVAAAITAAPAEEVAAALRETGQATLEVDGRPVIVTSDQVQVIEEPRTGWTVASEAGYSVALDVTINTDLLLEGLARELVRALNDLRRSLDLPLDQRINLRVDTSGDMLAALVAHRNAIAAEVLAVDIDLGAVDGGTDIAVAGHPVRVTVQPIDS
jgi:isoleucyl-tRNA synthetase